MNLRVSGMAAILLILLGGSAVAGDITVFAARGHPGEAWAQGYGAALGSTWFKVICLEAEAAQLPGELPDSNMTSFMGSALLAPPVGAFRPYGGIGAGFFRQTRNSESDLGRIKAFVLGMRVQIAGLVVLRGDYRRLDLSGSPLIEIESRYSAGVGISF